MDLLNNNVVLYWIMTSPVLFPLRSLCVSAENVYWIVSGYKMWNIVSYRWKRSVFVLLDGNENDKKKILLTG